MQRALVRFPMEIRNMGALKGQFLNRAHAEPALAAREINLLPGGARGKYSICRILTQNGVKLGRILWAVIKSTLGSEFAIPTQYQISAKGGT